ncbi:hypothetical protein E3N88_27832 [Mikania micrantha]|uniref:Uncharacterized protein n=1 Tax=Mikania micrantha TaxID=192012 RepID=A0A5N6MYC7_9ASTR|nr:hypothetical protein E3N88_27832 [Mikania micrantha]
MDEKFDDRASLLSRIEVLEHERDELRNDIEQMCMQHAEPNHGAVSNRMHLQRTAGLEQEIDDLKKKLTACLRENANLQEELSESYRIKNQLADLHAAELSKSLEAEKQIKFFQSSVAAAFSERDNAIMEAEQAKEKEEHALQNFGILQQRIEELNLVVLEEKKLSATLQTDLEKQQKENEIFNQVITKFYDIRQHSLNKNDDVTLEDKCTFLLNDSEDMWTFTGYGETSTTKYITALEEEVEALRKSVTNFKSKLQMGLEIEKHLKRMVHDLKNKNISLEEKIKRDIYALRNFHSQHRVEIVYLLEEESSYFKSVVGEIKENMRQICINELNCLSPQQDIILRENDCRDVHISPDEVSDAPAKENMSVLQKTGSSGIGDVSEVLAQALQEKVAALLLLSQQEERYLLENNVNSALQNKLEELQRNLIQVTNEKVVALMELAQLKQENRLLQEKLDDDVKQGKLTTGSEEKSISQDKDGRLKGLLKRTYFSQWVSPLGSHGSGVGSHHEYAQYITKKSSSSNVDFARMKIEYTALKESLESMDHLISSIHRLRLSLVKVKESVPDEDTPTVAARKLEIINNVVTEAQLLKTALGSSLPVSWSAEANDGVSSAEKVDSVSAAGFEMAEESEKRFLEPCFLHLVLLSMFGGHVTVPVNSPHLRKSGSRQLFSDLEASDMKGIGATPLATAAMLPSPVLLWRLKVFEPTTTSVIAFQLTIFVGAGRQGKAEWLKGYGLSNVGRQNEGYDDYPVGVGSSNDLMFSILARQHNHQIPDLHAGSGGDAGQGGNTAPPPVA